MGLSLRARQRLNQGLVILLLSATVAGAAEGDEQGLEEPNAADAAWAPLSKSLPVIDIDGRRWGRSDLEGKVVLVDFWATWCAPCLAELPHMKNAYRSHHEAGFEILAVSVDQTDKRTLRRWIRTQEVSWIQLHDNRGLAGELPRSFGVEYVPRSFLFDRQGRLVATDLQGKAFEAAVGALVGIGDASR